MAEAPSLDDIRRAMQARDPELASLIIALSNAPDPRSRKPTRRGALTFRDFTHHMRSWQYRHRSTPQDRARYRIDSWQKLEAEDAESELPDRLRLHTILMELWQDPSVYAREVLLKVIAECKLVWGPWRALKTIFKQAEEKGDVEVLMALAARFDGAYGSAHNRHEVTRKTLGYLVRRGWRYLRRLGETLPASYADACVSLLCNYPERTRWANVWIANHVLFHESTKYTRRNFRVYNYQRRSLVKERAFGDLWRRSPRPLFALLSRAQSEHVRTFAAESLKADFRAQLREVEPAWVVGLVSVGSRTVDDFVVWLLGNAPRFEQASFRELGLHDAVIRLLDSQSQTARTYAAEYARTHARDLPLERLLRLANNNDASVRKLAHDLLGDRDPRTEVGLAAWGALLGTRYAHDLAATVLRKHFGSRELTRQWFTERLLDANTKVVDFVRELLPQVYSYETLGAGFFRDLLDRPDIGRSAAAFALDGVTRFATDEFGVDFLRRILLHPLCRQTMVGWLREQRISPAALGVDFLKSLSFHPTFEADTWVTELKQTDRKWARDLEFSESLAETARELLGDTRRFSPDALGFDWLMTMVERSEPQYHEFAVAYLIKAFVPAQFADTTDVEAATGPVSLAGKSVRLTGEFETITVEELGHRVTDADGVLAEGVTADITYVVVGDRGSPLGGAGRKTVDQVAAERLIADGVPVQLISEADFLALLAGTRKIYSDAQVLAGCEALWTMAIDPGAQDAPRAVFARRYLLAHHPQISLAKHGKPVPGGAEVPAAFLTYKRVRPLLDDARFAVRAFALELCRQEFARWLPGLMSLVPLAESNFPEVRDFISISLLADEAPEHRRYRYPPEHLSGDAVYSFCESLVSTTRGLGMALIEKHPRLAVPEELFRLTESPDRQVRAFVIATVWSLYRDRGVTLHWKPNISAGTPVGAVIPETKSDAATDETPEVTGLGDGPPKRPERRPASDEALRDFMRRVLFMVPPAKIPAGSGEAVPGATKLRPLPARKAKLALVEVMRDLAIGDREFAGIIAPLLKEFMGSRGQTEHATCLVALARIARAHDDLNLLAEDAA